MRKLNMRDIETQDFQLNNFGIASYIAILVFLVIGTLISNLFTILDIFAMLLFLYFINRGKKHDGNITVVSIIIGLYWILSMVTGAYVQMFLLPFAYIGMVHMSLHPERAPKFLRPLLK